MKPLNKFLGAEYLDAMKACYPSILGKMAPRDFDLKFHIGFFKQWSEFQSILGVDPHNRFQRLEQRSFSSLRDAWAMSADTKSEGGLRRLGASCAYKGLIHLKPPGDITLYANLIWELRPATIIEFGALQGGSALWLADQMDACNLEGEVHSFELFDKCIHPSARHPRLHFHCANLKNLSSLDSELFLSFRHPWLVIDDAHENLAELIPFVSDMLEVGDYYVVEDILQYPTPDVVVAWVQLCERLRLLVDSKYTDAFGYNVTSAPNGWLRKF